MPETHFVLVSGYLTVDATVAAVRAGADVVMTKPVTAGESVRRVEEQASEPLETPHTQTQTLAQAESEDHRRMLRSKLSELGGREVAAAAERVRNEFTVELAERMPYLPEALYAVLRDDSLGRAANRSD